MYFPTEPAPVYPILASCMAVIVVLGCALQLLSLLILTRPSFQQYDLTPYYLSVVLGNLMVISADLPPLVVSAWSGKQLVGVAYCQVCYLFLFPKLNHPSAPTSIGHLSFKKRSSVRPKLGVKFIFKLWLIFPYTRKNIDLKTIISITKNN